MYVGLCIKIFNLQFGIHLPNQNQIIYWSTNQLNRWNLFFNEAYMVWICWTHTVCVWFECKSMHVLEDYVKYHLDLKAAGKLEVVYLQSYTINRRFSTSTSEVRKAWQEQKVLEKMKSNEMLKLIKITLETKLKMVPMKKSKKLSQEEELTDYYYLRTVTDSRMFINLNLLFHS